MCHTAVLRLLSATAGAALAIGGAEGLVRATVGMPRTPEALDAGLPALHQPDPVLGWRNQAGAVSWPGRGRDQGRPIAMTFWPGGLRATAPEPPLGRPEAVVVGCSYAQGWALSDADTFVWQLQQRFPDLGFWNLATAGYGTYQSLLALERFLPAQQAPVRLVVYAFLEHHELRNVAPGAWMRSLAAATSSGPLAVPYATLDAAGRLERHPPESAARWPLDDRLASVALLEARLGDAGASTARAGQRRAVTQRLLEGLRDTSAERGAQLLVAILEARPDTRRHYAAWLGAHGIRGADCADPRTLDPRFLVPGYGHPGREINARWAACIGRAIEALGVSRARPLETAAAPAAH